jgi:hypothetical protein
MTLSPFVLAELDYLLVTRVGRVAEFALLGEIARGTYHLEPFSGAVFGRRRCTDENRDRALRRLRGHWFSGCLERRARRTVRHPGHPHSGRATPSRASRAWRPPIPTTFGRLVTGRSVAGILLNERLGLPRLGLLRYRVSRLGLVGLRVAQLAFLRSADAFDASRLPWSEETEGGSVAVQEG